MDKVEFPAVIICSRWDHADDAPVAFVGCDPIDSDAELERRLGQFRFMEEHGGREYTYTLAALDDVERVMGERLAELEAQHRFGHREKPEAGESQAPASADDDGSATNHPPHDTTNGDGRQISLIVGYLGAFPPPPQTFATGQLVSYIEDGEPTQPPAHSLAETRLWLKAQGYAPDYTRWQAIDRAVPDGQRRKRLEVWVGNGNGTAETGGYWGSACATPRHDPERLLALAQERFGDNGRKPDEPFIPESGQGHDWRHPYAKLRGW